MQMHQPWIVKNVYCTITKIHCTHLSVTPAEKDQEQTYIYTLYTYATTKLNHAAPFCSNLWRFYKNFKWSIWRKIHNLFMQINIYSAWIILVVYNLQAMLGNVVLLLPGNTDTKLNTELQNKIHSWKHFRIVQFWTKVTYIYAYIYIHKSFFHINYTDNRCIYILWLLSLFL